MTGFPLHHCDNPMHGYDCFHLDDLTPKEEDELLNASQDFGYLETLAEVDEEINDVRGEQERAMEKHFELEEDLANLWNYRRLLEKKLKASA